MRTHAGLAFATGLVLASLTVGVVLFAFGEETGFLGPAEPLLWSLGVWVVLLSVVAARGSWSPTARIGGYIGTVTAFAATAALADHAAAAGCIPSDWFFFVVFHSVCPTILDHVVYGAWFGFFAALGAVVPLFLSRRRGDT